jgi:hypothetical protein
MERQLSSRATLSKSSFLPAPCLNRQAISSQALDAQDDGGFRGPPFASEMPSCSLDARAQEAYRMAGYASTMHFHDFSNTLGSGTEAGSAGKLVVHLRRSPCYSIAPSTTLIAIMLPLQGKTTSHHHAALTTTSVPNIPTHMESTIPTRRLDLAAGDQDRIYQ